MSYTGLLQPLHWAQLSITLMTLQDSSQHMWLQVNVIDETEKVVPIWSLSASQLQTGKWQSGRVKIVSKDNGDQYRVSLF